MTTIPETLPDDPFASLAFELRFYARKEAASVEDVEHFRAGLTVASEGVDRVLTDLRASALMLGRAATVLAILSRHETAVRALVADTLPAAPKEAV